MRPLGQMLFRSLAGATENYRKGGNTEYMEASHQSIQSENPDGSGPDRGSRRRGPSGLERNASGGAPCSGFEVFVARMSAPGASELEPPFSVPNSRNRRF